MSDSQKAAAEYWAPWGSSPCPHLLELTKFASAINDLRLDDDVKLFFVVTNAIFDASIATWDAKYVYNYVRPITAIRALGNVPIKTWRPRSLPTAFAYSTPLTRSSVYQTSVTPAAGLAEIQASEWEPYLPTPAFPAYVSGHSAFTAAWARAMELAMGHPDLNFSVTVKHLFVEQRDLAEPVTLSYPTFASAAEESGMSRIWGGIHWPADNERGQELGREVGENTWRRAQQFFLGTASPAVPIFSTLRRPYWTYDSKVIDRPARFQTDRGLEVDLTSGGVGTWQSIAADPMPAGAYQLKMSVAVKGSQPIRLRAWVEGSGSNNALLGEGETVISPSDTASHFTIPWTSDGVQSFRVSIEASSDTANGQLLVSDMSATRVGPTVAGSPRYYEMSSASLPGQ